VLTGVAKAIAGVFRSRAALVAENLCLRQQLLVYQRRRPRPRLRDADRRFWILASRWFWGWRGTLLIAKPETVLGWHRKGWRAYWRWKSRAPAKGGRNPIRDELKLLIRRMASENILWGQRRIQAELTRLGFKVSTRTVAKYMPLPQDRRRPSPSWRCFLERHAAEIWACDFFCVQTLWFKNLYMFFVVSHAGREVLHVRVTEHPTAEWAAQQIVECCAWDRAPQFLIRDRDSRYGSVFDRRLRSLGISQIRTPFRAPKANAIAERWVRSVRQECLDHTLIFGARHLRRVLTEYVTYFNHWRPHRSIGQRAPCAPNPRSPGRQSGEVVALPVLGGLHHVYQFAA
jgi:putative transposase